MVRLTLLSSSGMALAGLLSNPTGPLKVLLEGPPQPPRRRGQASRAGRSIAAQHRRVGWIVEAIVRVLADRQKPMQAKEIHEAVEALLGRPVCWSSVKAALAANASGPSPRFARVARGRYRLTET
jgi:hypothetical protein